MPQEVRTQFNYIKCCLLPKDVYQLFWAGLEHEKIVDGERASPHEFPFMVTLNTLETIAKVLPLKLDGDGTEGQIEGSLLDQFQVEQGIALHQIHIRNHFLTDACILMGLIHPYLI